MKFSISFLFVLLALHLILASANHGYYERAAYHDNYGAVQQDLNYEQEQHGGSGAPAQNDQNHEQEIPEDAPYSLKNPTLLDDLPSDDHSLSFGYYSKTCPQAEEIINTVLNQWLKEDKSLAASLMRLHFHDCAVHGCDGSILLDHEGSERQAEASKTLRGFEVIDEIKAELERNCSRTVSCADILTAVSRDATVFLRGPYWAVPYGRKDGKVSTAEDAESVPMGREDITTLIEFYQSKGLNVLDLVVLSGAHTIGKASCGSIQHRLYNFKGTGKPDPTLDHKYANYLTRKCRWETENVYLDGVTPEKFDGQYYRNLQYKMGLLSTDQSLYSDPRTSPIVDTLANEPSIFDYQFAVSMAKLGNILDPQVQDGGEIRTKCYSVNSDTY